VSAAAGSTNGGNGDTGSLLVRSHRPGFITPGTVIQR
jgi:hypothetical protein